MARLLTFDWSPIPVPVEGDPAETSTWAGLRIRLNTGPDASELLTEFHDPRGRTTHDQVFGSVLPLAEWFVSTWFHLQADQRVPPGRSASPTERYEWDRVHCWRYVGDGAALPDLEWWPIDDRRVALAWHRDPEHAEPADRPLRFLGEGVAYVERQAMLRDAADFVDGVIQRIEAVQARSSRAAALVAEWRVTQQPGTDEHARRLAAARLGRWYAELSDPTRQSLDRWAAGGDALALDLAEGTGKAELDAIEATAAQIRAWRAASGRSGPSWGELQKRIVDAHAGDNGHAAMTAWERGWAKARQLRIALQLAHDVPVRSRDVSDWLPPESRPISLADIQSVVSWDAGRLPVRAGAPPSSESGRGSGALRFWDARDLYPVLFGPPPDRPHVQVFSARVAGMGPVARAFATELLAPVEAIRARLGATERVDTVQVENLAHELGATPMCVLHQIENHGLADVVDHHHVDLRRA